MPINQDTFALTQNYKRLKHTAWVYKVCTNSTWLLL